MKSKLLIAAALIALVAAGCNKSNNNDNNSTGGYGYGDSQQTQTADQTQSSDQNSAASTDNGTSANVSAGAEANLGSDAADMPQVIEVKITASGFYPSTVTIKKGDYVQFVNTDTAAHWPASDPHPTHTDYPGFDALKGLANGETYRFQFNKAGAWGYHDHLHPSIHGTVIVQ